MPSTAPPQPPMSPAPGWREIGRPSPGEAQDWATWVAPLDPRGNGEALYRSLVLADGAIAVTVELHAAARRGGSGPRTIHRGRCGLPEDPGQTAERVSLLLGAADRAAAKAVQAHCGAAAGVAAGRARPAPHRAPDDALQDATWGGGASAAPHEREDRPRERARQEAATAA
jgi:hypothetical protein